MTEPMFNKAKLAEILADVGRLPSGKWQYTHYALEQGKFTYRIWDEANNVVAEVTFDRESDRDYAYALLDLITASPALAREHGELMEKVERLERTVELQAELITISVRIDQLNGIILDAEEMDFPVEEEWCDELDSLVARHTELKRLLAEGSETK